MPQSNSWRHVWCETGDVVALIDNLKVGLFKGRSCHGNACSIKVDAFAFEMALVS